MNYPSKLIADAVEAFSRLPGIGEKTALRLVLHMLQQDAGKVERFGDAITKMRREIKFCRRCHNVSDTDLCAICTNPMREHGQVCVVESIRDVLAIENTGTYQGVYHVLGGVISPVDGVGPEDIYMESLEERVEKGEVNEIIMALNPTMEGDTTIFYLSKRFKDSGVKITALARGVAFGGELEYTDELTLARSLATRQPYDNYLTEK